VANFSILLLSHHFAKIHSNLSLGCTRFTITSSGKGEKMDLHKHTQGTEIKAITYSNMKISETDDQCDIWVIVDI
jgi:SHS2 domain-containing protein